MKIPFLIAAVLAAAAVGAFEKLALVDSFDFSSVYDIETRTGNVQIVEHVLRTGADTVLWRNCSGGLMRYHSDEERLPLTEPPLDKLRIPESRGVSGWLRLDLAEPDIFRTAMEECARRGVAHGVHWPFEETHWSSWTLGAWNLAHPQFWGVSASGMPFYGRGSLAHPEVVAHKLRLLDELLARGADVIFIDLFRNGGWTPQFEYVAPVLKTWRAKYPNAEPPKDWRDPRWTALVAEYQHAYLRAVRARLDRAGRKARLILGIAQAGRAGSDYNWTDRAIDWRQLAREGVLDGIAVMNVQFDAKDPWGATRRVYDEVVAAKGRAKTYFPVRAYDYGNGGIPSYVKATKLSVGAVTRRLMEMAHAAGGDGIVMECVDYNNYSDEMCRIIREEDVK